MKTWLKKVLNLGLSCNLSWSSMSTHHWSLAFLFLSVRCGLILLVCLLTFPSFTCFKSVFLLTWSTLLASARVVLSFKGTLRSSSKFIGVGLRPHLPLFLLPKVTWVPWSSEVLPNRAHKRWTVRMCKSKFVAISFVAFFGSTPCLLLANNWWNTCFWTSSVHSFLLVAPPSK